MTPQSFEHYFAHEARIAAQKDAQLQRHREHLTQQAATMTAVLSMLGARRIWVFGSVARGQVRSASDLDMAVEGLPYAQDQLLGIAEHVLQHRVDLDLVPWEKAHPELRARIVSEGRLVYERESGTSE
ncbi:MAG: nucleotidyltransferase family protein [Limnochordia bacterium]|jgi:predicted nucleotidyltransferase